MDHSRSWLRRLFRPDLSQLHTDRVNFVRKFSRKTAALVAVVAALSVTAAACTAGNPGSAPGAGNSGADSSRAKTTPFVYSPCCSWNTSTFSNNPWNVNAAAISDFVFLRLAIQKYPSLTDYAPQLASSWTVSGSTLTVHLQPNAKWQDGTPVTSKDVYDTVLLNGLNGAAAWNDITKVAVVDTHTVAFTLRKGQPVALAENDILANTIVYQSKIYGQFVTPQLEKDVPAYYATYQKDPAAAAKMAAFGRNADVFKKLAALKVPKMIGDGPFILDAMSGAEAKLTKWNGSWLASKIKVDTVRFMNSENQLIYPQLFSNGVDYTNVILTPPLLKKWQSTSGSNLAYMPSFGIVIGINNARYPLNLTPVRQALAYVIGRQQITDAAYGSVKGAGGAWQKYLTGLSPEQNATNLTPAQLNKLNPYPVDTAKATQLLKGAGFTQRGGQWYTPKGKQFTLTIEVNSTSTGQVTSFTAAIKALTAFGIKSDVNGTSGAQLGADQQNGNFQLSGFTPQGTTSLQTLSSMLHDNNFQASGNFAGTKGIGFGPTADVPGLGKVNVASTIFNQASNTGPGTKLNSLSWDWAQLVNQQVPYIWYATKMYQLSFSSERFTNWPPVGSNGTSQIWNMVGNQQNSGIVYAMEQGYIQPK